MASKPARRAGDEIPDPREAQARLEGMLRTALDCIITIDHQDRILEFNPAAERTFGFGREEVLGRDLSELLIPTELRQRHRERLARHLLTGETSILDKRVEVTALRKDGSSFPVELAVTRVTTDPPTFTAYLRDITERQRAEWAMRDSEQRYRTLVEQVKDYELMEVELRDTATELREVVKQQTRFLAILSHELRNPLAPIRNAVEILRLTGVEGPAARAVEMIGRNVSHMVRLIDELFDLSRIRSGKIVLRRERFDLTPTIRNALEVTRPQCEPLEQELTFELPPEPVYVDGDQTRMSQVVGNLLHNAGKFTPKGGRIHVSLRREGSEAVLSVRDSGVGIPSDKLASVFGMFAQLENIGAHGQGGLGLGLHLAQSLVELHGGTLTAHSEGAGKGSEFALRMPAVD